MHTLLNAVNTIKEFPLLAQGYEINLNWLGKFARWIIEGVGIIGLGIIVFTIFLKGITLPFDIYQRVKMRKQNLIMREMQPELEKLQKQYANDKTTYNQKMMELYKKNGYSMLSACLPMIISLVILIVAFQGFRTYSQYANLKMYVDMSAEYNSAYAAYIVEGKDYHLPVEGQERDDLTRDWVENDVWQDPDHPEITYSMVLEGEVKVLKVTSSAPDKCIYYHYSLEETIQHKNYSVDTQKVYDNDLKSDILTVSAKEYVDGVVSEKKQAAENSGASFNEEEEKVEACKKFMVKLGATKAHKWYEGHNASFLWVKNVWYPDVSYNHPIQESYDSFMKEFSKTKVIYRVNGEKRESPLSAELTPAGYENLISEFGNYTKKPNGYFILIILSIGLMVLSQFISMKSQKESNKYQTVDGSGATSQKMMLVIMPLIYAVFAFMYSAAFSIYMTMSSAITILITLLSNLIIGKVFKKKEEQALKEKYDRTLPWQKKQQEQNKQGKKNKNK